MCTETPFSCARQRFRMWLAVLQLHHGRRSAAAAPEQAAVDGRPPPFGMPRSASLCGGSLPFNQSLREDPRASDADGI